MPGAVGMPSEVRARHLLDVPSFNTCEDKHPHERCLVALRGFQKSTSLNENTLHPFLGQRYRELEVKDHKVTV